MGILRISLTMKQRKLLSELLTKGMVYEDALSEVSGVPAQSLRLKAFIIEHDGEGRDLKTTPPEIL